MQQRFATTQWSVVLAAGRTDPALAQSALAKLCEAYWYPLYAFVRRQGFDADDACDLTQGYFARLLEKNYVRRVRRERGKFRSFLIITLKQFLSNEREKARALKRGGGVTLIPLEKETAEGRYRIEPPEDLTPEMLFDLHWAETVLDRVMGRLRRKYEKRGEERVFIALRPYLFDEHPRPTYAEIAQELGMKEGAVKVAVFRLRRRLGKGLRAEIAETVSDAEDLNAELVHLVAALSPRRKVRAYLRPARR